MSSLSHLSDCSHCALMSNWGCKAHVSSCVPFSRFGSARTLSGELPIVIWCSVFPANTPQSWWPLGCLPPWLPRSSVLYLSGANQEGSSLNKQELQGNKNKVTTTTTKCFLSLEPVMAILIKVPVYNFKAGLSLCVSVSSPLFHSFLVSETGSSLIYLPAPQIFQIIISSVFYYFPYTLA